MVESGNIAGAPNPLDCSRIHSPSVQAPANIISTFEPRKTSSSFSSHSIENREVYRTIMKNWISSLAPFRLQKPFTQTNDSIAIFEFLWCRSARPRSRKKGFVAAIVTSPIAWWNQPQANKIEQNRCTFCPTQMLCIPHAFSTIIKFMSLHRLVFLWLITHCRKQKNGLEFGDLSRTIISSLQFNQCFTARRTFSITETKKLPSMDHLQTRIESKYAVRD